MQKQNAVMMRRRMFVPGRTFRLVFTTCFGLLPLFLSGAETKAIQERGYVLGPEDILSVRVIDLDEFSPTSLPSVRIDTRGDIRLPIVGRIHAAGTTASQLETEISKRLLTVINEPDVAVSLLESKSHPVSVLGAVKTPGVYQIAGKETLYEVLSLAGGLATDAGNIVKITRRAELGVLPLPNAQKDASGEFYVGQLNLRAVMNAKSPTENIDVLANDVISVPKAELVYVVGAVKRPGGFVLSEKDQMSALQALSLAEGLDTLASAKNARILHQDEPGRDRSETTVNLQRILTGQDRDVSLHANDILFIPTSVSKNATIRGLEAAIQLGTGLAIYRR